MKTSLFKYLILSIIIVGSLIITTSNALACYTVQVTAKPKYIAANENSTSKLQVRVTDPAGAPVNCDLYFEILMSPSSTDSIKPNNVPAPYGSASTTLHHKKSKGGYIWSVARTTIVTPTGPQLFEGRVFVSAVGIDIKQDGNPITDTSHNEIIGKRIKLEAEVQPSDVPITEKQWSIPGNKVADYIATLAEAKSIDFVNTSDPTINFCWVDAAEGRQVKYTATIEGKSISGKATFNVKKPIVATMTAKTGTVAADSNFNYDGIWLHYGDGGNSPGIFFSESTIDPSGFVGTTAYWQVVTSIKRTYKIGKETWILFGKNLLDNKLPYPSNAGITDDSPGRKLTSDLDTVTVDDNYRMLLMYKPNSDSIWVPLRYIDWSWSGTAKRVGLVWRLTASKNTVNPISKEISKLPTWKGIRNDLTYIKK